jgi:hypothetical protein
MLSLSMVLFHYLSLLTTGMQNSKSLTNFERDLMEEGISKKAFARFKSVRVLNTVFKLKNVLMIMCIVIS